MQSDTLYKDIEFAEEGSLLGDVRKRAMHWLLSSSYPELDHCQ